MDNSQLKEDALRNIQSTDLKSFSLTNEDVNILTGWNYITMFIVEAKTSLKLSEEHNRKEKFTSIEDVTLAHGMFKNFILSYAKCFSSSGKGRISLDAKEVFQSRSDLMETHQKIMQTRNTYVAHNDENLFSISLNLTSEENNEIILAHTYTIMTPLGDYKAFSETLEFCESQVILKYNKKIDKIQARIGRTIRFK